MSVRPWEEDWFYIDEEAPEGECGFATEYSILNHIKYGNMQCNRPIWNDTNRCVWHAEVDEKPLDALQAAREDEPERLDGAYLASTTIGNRISFEDCVLIGATLRGAHLIDANLVDVSLPNSDLTSASLFNADLTDADLRGADLTETNLFYANLTDASFASATLIDANLRGADLTDAYLYRTNLTNADLREADFTDTDMEQATLINANLGRTKMTRTDFFDADLTGTRLYGAVFEDPQVNSRTKFGDHYADALRDSDAPEADGDSDFSEEYEGGDPESNPDHDETPPRLKAIWTNRQVEQLAQQNALREVARQAYVERKELRREQYHEESRWGKYAWATLAGTFTGYAEDPWRVIYTSIAVIVASGFVYPFVGGMEKTNAAATSFAFDVLPAVSLPIPDWLGTLLANQYFSAVTFTTLGYGDIQPASGAAQLLATVESFVGALLMALLVFVLGRRTTW